MSFDSLYQEIILEHYKHPRNRASLDDVPESEVHENPACGDSMKVRVELAEGRMERVLFDGAGCAISTASASMMTELLRGRTLEDARVLIASVLAALRGDHPNAAAVLDSLGDMAALAGVGAYAVRIKCATLAWHAAAFALDRADGSRRENT